MTLPLAGALGLLPWAAVGAVEVFMAAMVGVYRYERRGNALERQAKVALLRELVGLCWWREARTSTVLPVFAVEY